MLIPDVPYPNRFLLPPRTLSYLVFHRKQRPGYLEKMIFSKCCCHGRRCKKPRFENTGVVNTAPAFSWILFHILSCIQYTQIKYRFILLPVLNTSHVTIYHKFRIHYLIIFKSISCYFSYFSIRQLCLFVLSS